MSILWQSVSIKGESMCFEYKSVSLKFKKRWTNSDVNTEELDDEINRLAIDGLELVSVNVSTLFGYPQSALCVFKKRIS